MSPPSLHQDDRETHSLSRASKIYGHKAFQITHTPLSTVAAQHYATPQGCTVELASALTAATILADAAVTPTVSEVTYNVSSGMLNHTQPTKYALDLIGLHVATITTTRMTGVVVKLISRAGWRDTYLASKSTVVLNT